jgi:hypothetical protein
MRFVLRKGRLDVGSTFFVASPTRCLDLRDRTCLRRVPRPLRDEALVIAEQEEVSQQRQCHRQRQRSAHRTHGRACSLLRHEQLQQSHH